MSNPLKWKCGTDLYDPSRSVIAQDSLLGLLLP